MTSAPLRHLVIQMETRVTDQAAFILRRRDWRNSSLIVDLFTEQFGLIRAVAKGARRNPAKAPFQPFELLSLGWTGQHELKTLTGVESQVLPIDEHNYLMLLYVNELLTKLLPPGESNPEIFLAYLRLLHDASDRLQESRLRRFELELLRDLGYFPDISHEAGSGRDIAAENFYQFAIGSGFVECAQSAPNATPGRVVLDWADGNYEGPGVARLAKSVLRSSIDFNLHGKTLKSRDVYIKMMRRQ